MTDNRKPHDTPHGTGMSPYDTVPSAALRFVGELLAWTAGPWAAADLAGSGWAALVVLAVLVALPAVFSTPGDKRNVVVPTPGPVRLLLEVGLWVVAVIGAWAVWPVGWAGLSTAVVAAGVLTGVRRSVWLLRGAPTVEVSVAPKDGGGG